MPNFQRRALFATRTQIGRRIAALVQVPLASRAKLSPSALAMIVVSALVIFSTGIGLRRVAKADDRPSTLAKSSIEEVQAAKPDRAAPGITIAAGGRRSEAIAFDRAGKLMVTGGWDETEEGLEAWRASRAKGVLQLWNAETGDHLGEFAGSCGAIFGVALSPDGKLVATAGRIENEPDGGAVKLWDVATKRLRTTLVGHTNWVLSAAFSPDGKRLATCGFDYTARVWDVASGKEVIALPRQRSYVDVVAFSPDGELLATGARAGAVKLWETKTWNETATLESKDYFLLDAVFSPDGKKIAVAGQRDKDGTGLGGQVRVWDLEAGEVVAVFPGKDLFSSAAFSPDGRLLAAVGIDPHVVVWDLKEKKEYTRFEMQGGSSGDNVVFLPTGAVAFTTDPGQVSIRQIDK